MQLLAHQSPSGGAVRLRQTFSPSFSSVLFLFYDCFFRVSIFWLFILHFGVVVEIRTSDQMTVCMRHQGRLLLDTQVAPLERFFLLLEREKYLVKRAKEMCRDNIPRNNRTECHHKRATCVWHDKYIRCSSRFVLIPRPLAGS